jgi:hypothetical protein
MSGCLRAISLKDALVADPISHVSIPRFAAAVSRELPGQNLYLIGEETRREFAEKNKIAVG